MKQFYVSCNRRWLQGLPGGSVVSNPLSSAGDMGLIPDLWRSHMHGAIKPVLVLVLSCVQLLVTFTDCSPLGFSVHGFFQARILEWVGVSFSRNEVHVPQLLNLCSRACDLQQEKPLQWEACAPQLESKPAHHNQRKTHSSTKTQHSQQ